MHWAGEIGDTLSEHLSSLCAPKPSDCRPVWRDFKRGVVCRKTTVSVAQVAPGSQGPRQRGGGPLSGLVALVPPPQAKLPKSSLCQVVPCWRLPSCALGYPLLTRDPFTCLFLPLSDSGPFFQTQSTLMSSERLP